jgi:catechol 2,3-dioxygenase-like lactoylglutathione lyase family enzyme
MVSGSPVLDHVALLVSDMEASRRFYLAALAPLGFRLLYENDTCAAFGTEGHDDFAICLEQSPTTRAHIAFTSPDRAAVDAFHAAALAAGGRDNGPPALRPEYHPGYYGGFVWDPDGNNIEAVHHTR